MTFFLGVAALAGTLSLAAGDETSTALVARAWRVLEENTLGGPKVPWAPYRGWPSVSYDHPKYVPSAVFAIKFVEDWDDPPTREIPAECLLDIQLEKEKK